MASAAEQLEGLELSDGWVVTKRQNRPTDATGGHFSHGYLVRNGEREGFLKAFDFSDAFSNPHNTLEIIPKLIASYTHERDLLKHCKDRKLSNIVVAIAEGFINIPKMSEIEGRVYYLIFEKAQGDIRIQMSKTNAKDSVWCLNIIFDVALGLHQVHREMIAHQDLKPSNILLYKNNMSKIADFGRASRKGMSIAHDNNRIAGDRTYAPPELLYGYTDPEFIVRRFGCDMYLLGNLIVFMFLGANVTASLFHHLDQQFHPSVWQGTYEEIVPYLQNSFSQVINDIKNGFDDNVPQELISIIEELCNPDIKLRGLRRGVSKHQQYSLERYVSRLDRIKKETQFRARVRTVSA
ncbi:MAG: protein kinase [Methylocystis sp.]|nr:protein kinase [Methylocystis sp.]MCA3584006.1 protein kinase [Methylocystis sp.]MCA3586650.1 protein kinase [Methylocystis sp.]MCA3591530.1 protein kinase [Methylocystis sp.]